MLTILERNFKLIFFGLLLLFAFMLLVQGCNKPSRVWNWNRTRIWNRGDGNWFDWRRDNRESRDDDDDEADEKDNDDGRGRGGRGGRGRWRIFSDDGARLSYPGESVADETEKDGSMDMVFYLLIGAGVLGGIYFFVLTPEQQEKFNPFSKSKKASKPDDMRPELFDAYCLLYDNLKDETSRKSLNEDVLPKLMGKKK